MARGLLLFEALILAASQRASETDRTARRLPAPLDQVPGGRADCQQQREAWIERLHRAAPGTD